MKPEKPYEEPLRDDQLLVVSVSGGKDSTALALYFLHEAKLPNPLKFVFADTGWEHPDTYEYLNTIEAALGIEIDRVAGKWDFVSLCEKKGRFPSAKARFCTEELKVKPIAVYVDALIDAGEDPVVAVGIRADESLSRSKMSEWGFSSAYDAPIWRPLLKWSAGEVFNLHKKHGVPVNPLYKRGAARVGCYPCIMSRKSEFAHGFRESGDLLEKLEEAEKRVGAASKRGQSTFLPTPAIPERFHDLEYTRDDGVRFTMPSAAAVRLWALDGDQPELWTDEDVPSCFSQYGLCE
jgi:3'-phosphoadenosine 5'-phosphosulfate sulfotransferase (PAPS reductase)/FAD synthetase